MAVNDCPVCLVKQRRIDELEEEVKNLRAKVRYQERREEDGFFGSSTPSSKKPVKPNSEQKAKKPRGAKPGHRGVGRTSTLRGRVIGRWMLSRKARSVRNAVPLWRTRGGRSAALWTRLTRRRRRSCFVSPSAIVLIAAAMSLLSLSECYRKAFTATNSSQTLSKCTTCTVCRWGGSVSTWMWGLAAW